MKKEEWPSNSSKLSPAALKNEKNHLENYRWIKRDISEWILMDQGHFRDIEELLGLRSISRA